MNEMTKRPIASLRTFHLIYITHLTAGLISEDLRIIIYKLPSQKEMIASVRRT